MSELDEQRWAVVSERGCEAARLTYLEAAELMRRLKGERVYGTCVITAEAAARLSVGNNNSNSGNNSSGSAPNGRRPAPAKKPRRKKENKS